jgi:hypothetical protein
MVEAAGVEPASCYDNMELIDFVFR